MQRMKQSMQLIFGILTCFTLTWAQAQGDVDVPLAHDLAAESQAAQAKQLPVLVLFMSPKCPYCEQVLKEFLIPMQHNPEYGARVVMRQVAIDSNAKLLDFAGHATTHAQFSAHQKIKLVPTIKLFDVHGKELTDPIVGLLTPDFYGSYLDQAIGEALAKVRATGSSNLGSTVVAHTQSH
jgi:thioredoxin-related protein